MITVKDIAWATGFLEGGGSFVPQWCQGRSLVVRLAAVQTGPEPLKRLQKLFGGGIVVGCCDYRSFSYEPTKKSPMYTWQLRGFPAIQVMMTIYVLMSPRRQAQIRQCLEPWKTYRQLRERSSTGLTKQLCTKGLHSWNPKNMTTQKRCKPCQYAARGLRAWAIREQSAALVWLH